MQIASFSLPFFILKSNSIQLLHFYILKDLPFPYEKIFWIIFSPAKVIMSESLRNWPINAVAPVIIQFSDSLSTLLKNFIFRTDFASCLVHSSPDSLWSSRIHLWNLRFWHKFAVWFASLINFKVFWMNQKEFDCFKSLFSDVICSYSHFICLLQVLFACWPDWDLSQRKILDLKLSILRGLLLLLAFDLSYLEGLKRCFIWILDFFYWKLMSLSGRFWKQGKKTWWMNQNLA